MSQRLRSRTWAAGWPVREALVLVVRGYRVTLGQVVGGGCRFHPSCSAYAVQALRELGVLRGVPLSVWRMLRCSPLTKGGIDYPPGRPAQAYDAAIQRNVRS